MFKWLKDRYNKYVNDRLIALYPKMHYRQRKKNAIRLAYKSKLDEIKSHIYSYHKELSKWDSFQIHSKQLLIRLKVTLTLEIKHYSKLRNLRHLIFRQLRRTKGLLHIFIPRDTQSVVSNRKLERSCSGKLKRLILTPLRLDILAVSDLLDISELMAKLYRREKLLPEVCIDCELTFEKRWRDPDNPNKHLICSIIGD